MSSIVADVLSSVSSETSLETKELCSAVKLLTKQVDDAKMEVYKILDESYVNVSPSFQTTCKMSLRVNHLSTEVTSTREKIDQNVKAGMQNFTSEFQATSKEFNDLSKTLKKLKLFLDIHNALEQIERAELEKDYLSHAVNLINIKTMIGTLEEPLGHFTEILELMQKTQWVQEATFLRELGDVWNEFIVWEDGGDGQKFSVTLTVRIGNFSQKEITDFFQAMQLYGELEKKLKQFGSQLLSKLLSPVIQTSATVLLLGENALTAEYLKTTSKTPSVMQVFENLHSVFTFLGSILNTECKVEGETVVLMKILGKQIRKEFCDVLVKNCLSTAVPTSTKDYQDYNAVIDATENFNNFLVDKCFLTEDDTSILVYARNVDTLFANRMCHQILAEARDYMRQDLHVTVTVNPEMENEAFRESFSISEKTISELTETFGNFNISSNTFQFPRCQISQSTTKILQLVYSKLMEAKDSDPEYAGRLFYTTRHVFQLYCDIMPILHQQLLETLPQQSALLHNNCMYLAHHLQTLAHQMKPHIPAALRSCNFTYVDLIIPVRHMGTQAFIAEMQREKNSLISTIRESGVFDDLSTSALNFPKLEQCMNQVLHQLQMLQRVWSPVFPRNVYCKSIGKLTNSVVEEIIQRVISPEDIHANVATRLVLVLSHVQKTVPSLFKFDDEDGSPAEVHKHVPLFNRFSELIHVLDSNLRGIVERWADRQGPLAHEFSVDEVKHLIRALFMNTNKRADALSRIK